MWPVSWALVLLLFILYIYDIGDKQEKSLSSKNDETSLRFINDKIKVNWAA